MTNPVLVAIDLSEESSWRKTLPIASDLCRAWDAELRVMTVVPHFGMPIVAQHFPDDFAETATAEAKLALDGLCAKHVPKDIRCQTIVVYGTIYEEILKTARMSKAEAVVMAAHRPELKDYLLGPNAARVARHAPCSVMVVRE